jgi:hypothetical protein
MALVPPGELGDEELLGRPAQDLLAEWRPVVRQGRLVADEEDRAAEPGPPQGPRAACGGDATADEEDVDFHPTHPTDR